MPWGVTRCTPVQLDPVEAALQTLTTGLKRFDQTQASQTPGKGCELGGDGHLPARCRLHLGQELTQQSLAPSIQTPRPIGIRRINKTQTGCDSR